MLKNFSLVKFSVKRPYVVIAVIAAITVFFLAQFPKLKVDTNPKHMLPASSGVRVWNDAVDKTFSLYEDTLVVGVVNEGGVFNPTTLQKVARITGYALSLKGVAVRDVTSLQTVTNITAEGGTLRVAPLMPSAPTGVSEAGTLASGVLSNPLYLNRLVSADGTATAIYVPLEKSADAKLIADKLRTVVEKEAGPEKFYIAGDPVARETFGAEMFKLMAFFAPLAGVIMLLVRYFMFRDLFLSITLMMDAFISIIWSMGALIALGYPVHIMSSMAPVFLMAIATDSIHIFNEFYFRYREGANREQAIIDTMRAVGRPVRYTALATAVGFAVLIFMDIVPVKVFGGVIAFGTVALRFLSFSFIPAMFTFVKEKQIAKAAVSEDADRGTASRFLKGLALIGIRVPLATVLVGLALVVVSVFGVASINVNNNMVEWFKKGNPVRVADREMNARLGGTSLAYIVAESGEDEFMKTPQALAYMEGLQRHLEKLPSVGKTFSLADYVKRINLMLHDGDKAYDIVPPDKKTIGQYIFLFSMSARQSDLDNVVDYDFKKANLWIQLKTWDVMAMRSVIKASEEYKAAHLAPIELKPAGTAYFNLVWNDEVLWDMLKGFVIALAVIFVILTFNFGSARWALAGYLPLLFTILLIYGALGFAGKDFDMPVAVLSCLSLGMAVDFAIHFISRFRERFEQTRKDTLDENRCIEDALLWTAARPGKGIFGNAVLFASAFSVMLFAPLTPYITVGAFIVSMMTLSSVLTIIYLPAIIILFRNQLIKREA